MSKKTEKESAKQKEVKPKNEQEKLVSETSDLKEQKKVDQTENEGTELKLKKLEEDKLRLLAEIENKRKAFQQQMEKVYKYGNKIFVSQVLNFLIELEEKALEAMKNDLEGNYKNEPKSQELINKFKNHLVGIEIIKNNLKRRLEDEGVKEIEVKVGKDRADSRYHELIDEVENNNLAEGTIVEVVEKGYFFHEEVIRRVKIKTAKNSKKN